MRHSQSHLRRGEPIWLAAHRHPQLTRRFRSLRGDRSADVAIIGGGITGALIANAFADAGISVVVLERGYVGSGSTVASSALLLPDPDLGLAQLASRYGRASGRRILQLGHDAIRDLVQTLRRKRIDCDLVRRDAIYYATRPDAARRLRRELRLRSTCGFDDEWLPSGSLEAVTGIAALGGIRTTGNAQFDPYKACIGLMRTAVAAGAEVFERTAATRIHTATTHVRIHTRAGRIDASYVIVATGYATEHFRPLAGRFRMYRTYVLATAPLSESDRRTVGLDDVMLWDTEQPYHYLRWTPERRLLLGGADRPVRPGQRRTAQFASATRELRADFETLLPPLADIGIDHAWEGLFAKTPDSLPYIGPHRRYPRHLFALGYGGNGMTFGTLAARLLLEYWRGDRSTDQQLFRFGRLR
jgi:glycine/D-amino acid oxidase-like deaminating enzyme